jgi:hypothetical protein
MYEAIKDKLIENGWDEWTAGMTADKIANVGAEEIRDILIELCE